MTALALRTESPWRYAPHLLLLGSGGLLLGALFFQFVIGLAPCPLCLWQRYPHVAVVVLAAGALMLRPGPGRRTLLVLIGVALLATAAIGVFHAGVEQKWWAGLSICEGGGTDLPVSADDLTRNLNLRPAPRCDQIVWSLFGLTMAGWNAIISTALAAFAFLSVARNGRMG
ncbi:MAG: disulfide bond formation protein B [Rhodospirillaceae bacterium]|nr:disulfide bond formation protein B [Rhodospirillaceae bacterium]